MSINIHGLYGVSVGATLIGSMAEQSSATGTETRAEASSGSVYPEIVNINAQKPSIPFTSAAIGALLGAVPFTGTAIAGSPNQFKAYAQRRLDGGVRAGASLHRSYTGNQGMIVLRRLSWSHPGDVTLSAEAVLTWDGSNDPIVITDLMSLPAGLSNGERYTLGPVTLESTLYEGARGLDIDFGIQVQTESHDGEIWPRHASIAQIIPVVTLRGVNMEWLKAANIPLTGRVVTHTNTKIYLRRWSTTGTTVVANGTASHVKLTIAGMAHVPQPFNAAGNEPGETTLEIRPVYDGSNAPIVLTTGVAIT